MFTILAMTDPFSTTSDDATEQFLPDNQSLKGNDEAKMRWKGQLHHDFL